MRTLILALFALLLIPQAFAQDEGDTETPEPQPEPVIEMTAGEFSCYEQGAQTLVDSGITASTVGNQIMCAVETNNSRRSCATMRSEIVVILNNEEYGCSHDYRTGMFLGDAFINGSFVCRGSRNQMVNLTADFCEWVYQH